MVPQSPLCRPLSSLRFPSAVKWRLVTVALPSCLGVLCDQGRERPVKAPCKGQGSVNVKGLWSLRRFLCLSTPCNGTPLQYSCLENPMDGGAWWAAVCGVAQSRTRLSDLAAAAVLPAVCSCSRSTSPSVLLGLQAWAASRGHRPGLNKSLDMSRQEMTVPRHPIDSDAEQALNTPFCDKFKQYQAEFHLLPHGPPGQEIRPEVKDRGPQHSLSQASGRVAHQSPLRSHFCAGRRQPR